MIPALIVEGAVRVSQMEVGRKPTQRFGVSQEQVTAWAEDGGEPADERSRVGGREVHEQVAAKDDVLGFGLPQVEVLIGKVAGVEPYGVPRRVVQNEFAAFGPKPSSLHIERRVSRVPRPRSGRAWLFRERQR